MGTLRSTQDWTGRDVNGVTLGEPTRANPGDENTPPSGDYIWDHPTIPSDWIDDNGDIWLEVDDGPQGA
jgi:hypothetical protein